MSALITTEHIQSVVLLIRGAKVILDADLAALYGVPIKRLNEQVRRNIGRFPPDFMFQLNNQEVTILRSQIATSRLWGGRRYLPYAFTEQGVAMLSSVLNSDRAISANIEIMRAFVKLRGILAAHKDLSRKLDEMEKRYDSSFRVVFDAIRKLMEPPPVKARPKIGFELKGLSSMKKQNGSAIIEIIPAASFIALFILICVQFAALFTQAVHDVARAESESSKIVNDWDVSRAGNGFERPCLENMPVKFVSSGGSPVVIGSGRWKKEIGIPQEVKIVREPICVSW